MTLWTVAHQAPLSTGFSRQEYWNGLLCPPGKLPDPGIKSTSSSLPLAPPGKPQRCNIFTYKFVVFYMCSKLLGTACMCVYVCVLVTQSYPTFCGPLDCSPPGSSVMGFSRQEHWSELPFPSPGDHPNPGTEPRPLAYLALQIFPNKKINEYLRY